MQLPYVAVAETRDSVTKNSLDELMHAALKMSEEKPCSIELFDDTQQRFLFFRERQVYSAGLIRDGQLTETSIRDFLLALSTMNFPQLRLYELDNKTLHSVLILFQKKPALKVITSLVDLDALLDRIESEGKSCVIAASRENFLAVLRYEKGSATAMSHELSSMKPGEATFRDDFLVKIYTITAEKPLTINLYEDLLVSYATDAKTIAPGFAGPFEQLFLSKPPIVTLLFRGKEIDHWVFDRSHFNIGRTPDNDIVIDNLAVSRLHAVLEEEKGSYYVRDCDSLNGTVVNGSRVGRSRLEDGDEISIGKHTITFRKQGGQVAAEETIQGFDQTMIMDAKPRSGPAPQVIEPVGEKAPAKHNPRFVIRTDYGDRVVEFKGGRLTIGKDAEADLYVDGMFVAREHAEITREHGKVVLRKLAGLRKVTVDGKPIKEIELEDSNEIRIGNESFIFQS